MPFPVPAAQKPKPAEVIRFLLQPCKLRDNRVVPTDDPPVEYSWQSLCAKFAPARTREAMLPLRSLQLGAYVGLVRGPKGAPANFVFVNADRSGKLSGALIKDSSFPERVIEVYRADKVDWGARTIELG